jgi:predicted nuclease of predicted toxin-antitoxin system
MKILVDVNLSPQWVAFLTEYGHDAEHWSALGDPSAEDSVILEYASNHGCVILTHDLDFGVLLAHGDLGFPSVVQLRHQDPMPDTAGAVLIEALHSAEEHILRGALVSVDHRQHRVRILPIRP